MQIRLLVDYRGRETQEALVLTGQVVEMRDTDAQLLIKNGWAEVVEMPPPEPKPTTRSRRAKEGVNVTETN